MSEFSPIDSVTVGIPGAGRRTLLGALKTAPLLPAAFRLCVLDAERLDAPAQLALLDELAADSGLEILFALNKSDLLTDLRSTVTQTLALLHERGFSRPSLYPVCAAAARFFRRADESALLPEDLNAQIDFYGLFGPGERCLSAFAVAEVPTCRLGSREVTPEQLRLALVNTGLPALEAALALIPQKELESAESPAPEAELRASEQTADDGETAVEADAPVAAAPEEAPPSLADLEALLALSEKADCAGILSLANQVKGMDAPDKARERAMELLHARYNACQTEELDALTRGADSLDLPSLRALADRIGAGPYTVLTRTPYIERLNRRMDALQVEALEALCKGVEDADGRTLAHIREQLERVDCAEVLKSEFFQRIDARQDTLDVKALDRVIAGADTMSEKELRAVAVTLEAGNWNPKYVSAYRHKIDLFREAAIFRSVDAELAELNDMERPELLALRDRIAAKDLAPRFTAVPLSRIDERLYRMDMLRLMAFHNDFDQLDFDGIDALRAKVLREDFSDRARAEYLGRLLERERALIVENTDARAQLVRQLIGQHKLRVADFEIASNAPTYREHVNAFWGGTGMEQPRDLPVFLLENGSDYALTGERFYYKVGRDLAFVPISDISRLQTLKQHMSLMLQIVRKDNTYLLTGSKLSRSGTERTLAFLNECIRRWNEPGMVGVPPVSPIRTGCFEASAYTAPVEPALPDERLAQTLFGQRYDAEKLREGCFVRAGDEGCDQRRRRLLGGFGLPESTPLIWFSSAALLGAVREGVAVGPHALYQKESRLPVQLIPLADICAMTPSGKQATVTTVRGQSFRVALSAAMLPIVEDYVRAVQLGAFLRAAEEQA